MKKEISCSKNTNENAPVKLNDFEIDQITTYVKKLKNKPDPIKFESEFKDSDITINMAGFENGDSAFERHMALNKTTGLLNAASSVQLLNQVAACENPPGVAESKASLDKAACMMLELQPQDAFEGLLISQMVAAQNQAMECLRLAGNAQIMAHRELYLRFADRFMRTFSIQMGTLSKYRRGGQQKVIVEHVHINEGGQAIIGEVHHQGGGSDEKK